MGKAHQSQKQSPQPKSETNTLTARERMKTIKGQQIPPTQSSTQTHLDLRRSAIGGTASNSNIEMHQCFQSNTVRSILNAAGHANNHRVHEDFQTNTVLSEVRKKNDKSLTRSWS
jgi:hypothetical protein